MNKVGSKQRVASSVKELMLSYDQLYQEWLGENRNVGEAQQMLDKVATVIRKAAEAPVAAPAPGPPAPQPAPAAQPAAQRAPTLSFGTPSRTGPSAVQVQKAPSSRPPAPAVRPQAPAAQMRPRAPTPVSGTPAQRAPAAPTPKPASAPPLAAAAPPAAAAAAVGGLAEHLPHQFLGAGRVAGRSGRDQGRTREHASALHPP